MTGYKANVAGAWNSAGSGLQFQSSHPGWEAQLARVNIVVNTQNVNVAGPLPAGVSAIPAGAGGIHCNAKIYKTPDDNTDFGARGGAGTWPANPSLSWEAARPWLTATCCASGSSSTAAQSP